MMNKHAKSPCCNAPVRRYGTRRRQCIQCSGTWRIRQKKRGRKRLRQNEKLVRDLLHGTTTCVAAAERCKRDPSVIRRRCRGARNAFLDKTSGYAFPSGKLILIVDGLWTYFHHEGRFTLYLMAVRATESATAHFLDPVLLPGQENIEGWRRAIATVPDGVRQRMYAMVSDGLRGLKRIAEENGWVFQRCHFHLLAWFQKRHGQYFQRGKSKWIRDAILAYVQVMVETIDQKKLQEFRKELDSIVRHPDCPRYLAMRIHEFLRTIDDFRAYLRYPELNLPTTSNTVETMIRLLRKLLREMHGLRTPDAFQKWTTAYIRFKRTLTCNGKNSTKFLP